MSEDSIRFVAVVWLLPNKVSGWAEWNQFPREDRRKLSLVRHNARQGVVSSKQHGVDHLTEKYKKSSDVQPDKLFFVFLDAHVLVSENWLLPMAMTLNNYPRSLVYPILDVLVPRSGSSDFDVVKADNVVAAFDWSLQPKWESAEASGPSKDSIADYDTAAKENAPRLKHLDSQAASSSDLYSPAAPGIFAVKQSFLAQLGGFERQLMVPHTYYGGEAVELSLRTWLTGGSVIRQACSRVAHLYKNLNEDAAAADGATLDALDAAVMSMAAKWTGDWASSTLPNHESYKEIVYQARFLQRVPYYVETNPDPVRLMPAIASFPDSQGVHSQLATILPFQWYLKEVYPGLLHDMSAVQSQYQAYLQTNYLEAALDGQLQQYAKKSNSVEDETQKFDIYERKEELLKSNPFSKQIKGLTMQKRQFVEPGAKKKKRTREDFIEDHTQRVRNEFYCADINIPREALSLSGDMSMVCNPVTVHQKCETNKDTMLFLCPKSCGFCDVATGKFCEDFYLRKCPMWAEEGRCEENLEDYGVVKDVCRKSCGACTPEYMKHVAKKESAAAVSQDLAPPIVEPPVTERKPADIFDTQLTVDPGQLHRQFLRGEIDENQVLDASKRCMFNGLPNGNLLSRVTVHEAQEGAGVRIFCGVYTYEKNHATNVQATRNTWAKKCDGFIAFSTKEDASIPAINIQHEGDESYDNMWQKSRAIWKFIHKHLKDQYDYFLLGGDDMFYIVENLRYYLNSEEMVKLRSDRIGLYLGRIFQPPKQIVFNSGGAGYLLDSKAVQLLGDHIDEPRCYPHQRGFWEDVNVANCLQKISDGAIVPYDTRDSLERERFHPFTPGQHLTYKAPKDGNDWYPKYNPNLKFGYDCCSTDSISFHYVKESLLYQLYNYLYHCPNKS